MIPSADVIPGGADSIPLGRLGTPEEVANAVVMYATSGYTTVRIFLRSHSFVLDLVG